MNRKDIARYQSVQLSLLKYFDRVCKKHCWKYYMVFGTLLGAVRHKGFIPWDADIDVAMMREEYEKFIEYYINNSHPDLFLECWKTDPVHLSPHAILRIKDSHVYYNLSSSSRFQQKYDGIYIDIFPIDAITDKSAELKKQLSQIRIIQRIISLKAAPVYPNTSKLSKLCKKIVSVLLTPISFKYLHQREDEIMKKNNNKGFQYASMLTNPEIQNEGEIYPLTCFGKPTLLPFEKELFFAPQNAEQFVKIRYKDYMKLPPEDKRWGYLDKIVKFIDYGDSEQIIQKCIESIGQ